MNFKSVKHKEEFERATEKKTENKKYESAVYLLTADYWLWQKMKGQIHGTEIDFNGIHHTDLSVEQYTLFCCAKDIFLGTKHISFCDLSDGDLISAELFNLICTAVAVNRFSKKILYM